VKIVTVGPKPKKRLRPILGALALGALLGGCADTPELREAEERLRAQAAAKR